MKINPNDSRRVTDDDGLEHARFRREEDAAWYLGMRSMAVAPPAESMLDGAWVKIEALEAAQAERDVLAEQNAVLLGELAEVRATSARPKKIARPRRGDPILDRQPAAEDVLEAPGDETDY
jgi:hypothetical protein